MLVKFYVNVLQNLKFWDPKKICWWKEIFSKFYNFENFWKFGLHIENTKKKKWI